MFCVGGDLSAGTKSSYDNWLYTIASVTALFMSLGNANSSGSSPNEVCVADIASSVGTGVRGASTDPGEAGIEGVCTSVGVGGASGTSS